MAASDQRNGHQDPLEPGHERPAYPAHVRRILTGHPPHSGPGPRTTPRWARRQTKATASAAVSADAGTSPAPSAPAAGALTEWHEMSPGQLITAWADLRAWVTWLTDRYELTIEDRLPSCWARHPGLVEELWALRTWRKEIYGSGLRPAGQAARYWHSELDRVVHAASRYAAGCRAGHRGATRSVAEDTEAQKTWLKLSALNGVPRAQLEAEFARITGDWLTTEEMATALDTGEAGTVPGRRDYASYQGGWWLAACGGWYRDWSIGERGPDREDGL